MNKFEDFLKDKHAEDYHGTDDDMPDAFDGWVSELDVDELIEYANEFAKVREDLLRDAIDVMRMINNSVLKGGDMVDIPYNINEFMLKCKKEINLVHLVQ